MSAAFAPHPPLAADQADALRRLVRGVRDADPAPAARAEAAGARTVVIASGKGGVGKTSLAVNLSIRLAAGGLRVTLLDGDLALGNADVLLGVAARGHVGQAIHGRRSGDEVCIDAPGGVRLAPGAAGVAELADLSPEALRGLLRTVDELEASSDVLVVDCGAGVSRGTLALIGSADLAVIVATPEPTSIADAYATIKCCLAERVAPPEAFALFINAARSEADAHAAAERVCAVAAKFLGVRLRRLGWAPMDPSVPEAVRSRTPFVIARPDRPAARAVDRMASDVRTLLGIGESPVAHERPRSGLAQRLRRALGGVTGAGDARNPARG